MLTMTTNVTMNTAQVFRPGQCDAHFHVHNIIKSNVSPPGRVLWPDVGVGRIITNHYYLNSNFQSLFIIATRSSWGDLGTHHSQPAPALQHRVRSLSNVDSESVNVSINVSTSFLTQIDNKLSLRSFLVFAFFSY